MHHVEVSLDGLTLCEDARFRRDNLRAIIVQLCLKPIIFIIFRLSKLFNCVCFGVLGYSGLSVK